MKVTRTLFAVLAVLAIAGAAQAFAEGGTERAAAPKAEPAVLEIISHAVHKSVATTGTGGDIVADLVKKGGLVKGANWNTLEIGPLHDRLFREASLPSTDVAVAYILNTYALPRVANLLEPLDEYMKKAPIEGFKENFGSGMINTLTFNGKLYGVPMRAASHAFGYNADIFKERGVAAPPRTPEELYEIAKKCTFKRADGTQVYGWIEQSHYYYTGVASAARMWDGDFITSDFKVVCNEQPMVNALTMLTRFYKEGILPQNLPSTQHAEKQRMIEQGTCAMTFDVVGKIWSWRKNAIYKNLEVTISPMAPETRAKYGDYPPVNTEFWSFAIPKNSKYKEQGWELIRELSSAEGALRMAQNGNGPTRESVFKDPKYAQLIPYADVAMKISRNARVPIRAFDKAPQAMELIDSYIEKALFAQMSPQASMDELAKKLKELSTELK
jgi:multiple sugar transport system substrate-binding protein